MSLALDTYKNYYGNTVHFTIIFNIFVLFALLNQINSRVINDDLNILQDINKNPLFIVLVGCEIGA